MYETEKLNTSQNEFVFVGTLFEYHSLDIIEQAGTNGLRSRRGA